MSDEVKLLPCDELMERALIAGRQAWKACREADGYSDDHVVACIVRAAIEATRPTDEVVERVARALNRSSGRGHEHDWESYVAQARAAIAAMKDAASD